MTVNHIQYTDTLRQGTDKINTALDSIDATAQNAVNTANQAVSIANNAISIANDAKTQAQSTQTQLDNIIIENGQSDAEVVQARTKADGMTFPLLKDRLDYADTQLEKNKQKIENMAYVVDDSEKDIMLALQDAINEVGQNGGGRIIIKAKEYITDQANKLIIDFDNIHITAYGAKIKYNLPSSGNLLSIGVNRTPSNISIQGLEFENIRPYAPDGFGEIVLCIENVNGLILRDLTIKKPEMYGIMIRHYGEDICENITFDNVKVLECCGTPNNTSSIALETCSTSIGGGYTKKLKVYNSYFEIKSRDGIDTYESACSKLQSVQDSEFINTTFIGGGRYGSVIISPGNTGNILSKNIKFKNCKFIDGNYSVTIQGILDGTDNTNQDLNIEFEDCEMESSTHTIRFTNVKNIKFNNCKINNGLISIYGDIPESLEFYKCTFDKINDSINIFCTNSLFNNCLFNSEVYITQINEFRQCIFNKRVEEASSIQPNNKFINCDFKDFVIFYSNDAFISKCSFTRNNTRELLRTYASNANFIDNVFECDDIADSSTKIITIAANQRWIGNYILQKQPKVNQIYSAILLMNGGIFNISNNYVDVNTNKITTTS